MKTPECMFFVSSTRLRDFYNNIEFVKCPLYYNIIFCQSLGCRKYRNGKLMSDHSQPTSAKD